VPALKLDMRVTLLRVKPVQHIGLTRRSGSMAVFIGVLMVCSTIEASSCIVLTSPYSYSEEQEVCGRSGAEHGVPTEPCEALCNAW
jgi:hypothetical protein